MKTHFIWGMGGVGKSHMALRLAYQLKGRVLIITLDPSRRIFDLAQIPSDQDRGQIQWKEKSVFLRATNAHQLFEELSQKRPASPKAKALFDRMVAGLQEFRHYLALIQLADIRSEASFDHLIIDTPPFHEALGLHRAITQLKQFFEKSLVQLALKTSQSGFLQSSLKKVFEIVGIFVGRKAADQVFDFIEWLASHPERFQRSALALDEMLKSKNTEHHIILIPETPDDFIHEVWKHLGNFPKFSFVMNRSTLSFSLPSSRNDSFIEEIRKLQEEDRRVRASVKKFFPLAALHSVPLRVMGDDTKEELLEFVSQPNAE